MEIERIREFIVLAKILNYSATARHLNITQPCLSRHIQSLEKELGVPLFVRDTHGVELSDKGRVFLEGAQTLLGEYDALCGKLCQPAHKLQVGLLNYGAAFYYSNCIADFETAFPEVEVSLSFNHPEDNITALLARQLDVCILPYVETFESPEFRYKKIAYEGISLILHKDYPLAKQENLSLAHLKNEEFITVSEPYSVDFFRTLQALCARHGFAPRRFIRAASVEDAYYKLRPNGRVALFPTT